MSTIAYAQFTSKRLAAQPKTSTDSSPPGVKTYVDALAALVPAEVLALHGLILSVTTEADNGVTKIVARGILSWAFAGLIIMSIGLYVGSRLLTGKKWEASDCFRAAIPPLAFIGWTMLQRATAFDAVFPWVSDPLRTVIALFLAVILGFGATALAGKADQKSP